MKLLRRLFSKEKDEHILDFYFEGSQVGIFEEEFPDHDGTYSYMPYRSSGHYNLQQALKKSPGQRCHYLKDGFIYNFTVLTCPEYGRLELIDFDTPVKD
jgi:hypothetical protein